MNQRLRFFLTAAAQILIIVFTFWSVGSMFLYTGSGNMRVNRGVVFRYFTVDSNILCALSSLFLLFCRLHGRGGRAATLLRYMGTASVTVTMMTVLLFLSFLYGFGAMFEGWNLWLHGLGPLLSIVSFVWFERDENTLSIKYLPLAVYPVLAYGVVYLIMAVIIGPRGGGWPDFYALNTGGRWYLSYAGMLAGTLLIGFVLIRLRALGSPREKARS